MSDFDNDLDQYLRKVEIEFEGENYLVRDNGAVYRKQKPEVENGVRNSFLGLHAIPRR